MSHYFPKSFRIFERNINVKVDLSHYATKADIKNISLVDTSHLALKSNFASLKTEVDNLDIDKLVPVPVDSHKLSGIVKNDVKKTVYDQLKPKKTKYDADKSELVKKIPDTSGLVKNQIKIIKLLK